MKLWEYLLEADHEFDLSNVKNAKKWLQDQPFFQSNVTACSGKVEEIPRTGVAASEWKKGWRKNILALRSLVRRLKKKRSTRSFPDSRLDRVRADQALNRYLDKLQIRAKSDVPSPRGKYPELSATNFSQVTTSPTTVCADGSRKAILGRQDQLLSVDVFWQIVFWSLVANVPVPGYCGECGKQADDNSNQ